MLLQMKGTYMTKRQPFEKHKTLMHLRMHSALQQLLLRVQRATDVPLVVRSLQQKSRTPELLRAGRA